MFVKEPMHQKPAQTPHRTSSAGLEDQELKDYIEVNMKLSIEATDKLENKDLLMNHRLTVRHMSPWSVVSKASSA